MVSKQDTHKTLPKGATQGAPEGTEGATGVDPLGKQRHRWTAARKLEVVMSIVKGQSMDSVSRKFGIGQSEVSNWYKTFLSGAEELFKIREQSNPVEGEKKELLTKIGEITMDNELLREKIRRLENGLPFHRRR
jgi:transposase